MSKKPSRLLSRAVEFRSVNENAGDGRTLEGYAAVFDTPTEINSWEGSFNEQIAKGAFRKTLREKVPVLQFDHGRDIRTGSVPIGSIREIREDENGLFISARLYDNDVVEPIRQAIEGGSIDGMSFRFRVTRDEWRDAEGKKVREDELFDLLDGRRGSDRGPLTRTIKEVELFEAGPVVFPAYEATTVGVRSMLNSLDEEDRERLLRDILDALPEGVRTAGRDDAEEREDEHDDDESRDDNKLSSDAAHEGTSDEDTEEARDEPAVEPVPDADRSKVTSGTTEKVTTTQKEGSNMDTMSVEERQGRQDEIRERLAEIDREFAGAALTVERQDEWDALNDEYDRHDEAIDAATRRMEQLRRLAGDSRRVEAGSDEGRRRVSGGSVARRRPENIYDTSEIRNMARSEDDLTQLYRDNARRAVEASRFPGARSREAAQEQVERLLNEVDDDKGTLAQRILHTGSPTYERAFGKAVANLSTVGLTLEEQRSLAVGIDGKGGYAVPFQLDPSVILTNDGRINPLRSVSRVVQIVGKEWQGITSAGVSVSRVAEVEPSVDADPSIAQPTVRPTAVQALIKFSMDVDQDWAALRTEMTTLLADAKEEEEAQSFTHGLGTGVQPGGVVETLPGSSYVFDGGTFSSDDVYRLEEELGPRWRGNARFMGNKTTFNAVRQFPSADGHDLWERIGAGQPSELLGYPAHELSVMADHDNGDSEGYLLFGDFRNFLIVDRLGMSVELVPHIFDSSTVTPDGRRGIYARWRNSSLVLVPNAFRLLANGSGS